MVRSAPVTRSVLVSIGREPLLHFAALGALLFGLDAAAEEEPEPDRRIVVTDLLREELAREWEGSRGGPPSPEQLARLVDEWTDQEILYREGLARGFDEDDPSVRRRVSAKMAFVLHSQVVVAEPTEDELRAYFDEHAARWADEVRVSFTHVFVEGEGEEARQRAEALLETLRAGAAPGGLGDRFSGGRRYRGRALGDLAASFGEAFVAGLEEQPAGSWVLRPSRYGLHLVRIDDVTPARAPDFDTARADVRNALLEELRQAQVEERMRALRARWHIASRP